MDSDRRLVNIKDVFLIVNLTLCIEGNTSTQRTSLEIEHKVSQRHIPVVLYDEEAREILIIPGFVWKTGKEERVVFIKLPSSA